ncbi:MAG: homoserine kinase type protein [Pseudomonadota bacterium]
MRDFGYLKRTVHARKAGPHEAPYAGLSPTTVLDALDSVDLRGDGRLLALNSYENRVYLAYLEDGGSVVLKFYRPERWSSAQIQEEHEFVLELAAAEIPVVAPLILGTRARSLNEHEGYRFAVYPRRGGRAPELEQPGVLARIGRFIGRIHAVGAHRAFVYRPAITVDHLGQESRDWLAASGMLPPEVAARWLAVTDEALARAREAFAKQPAMQTIRLHGDVHPGNLLWTDEGPHFVDFDDARSGPAVQDLWMLLAGHEADRTAQRTELLAGYEAFAEFDDAQLALIEPLRTLRLVHYSAWIARRWHDPAFPAAFPWFGTARYWEERVAELQEQIESMQHKNGAAS